MNFYFCGATSPYYVLSSNIFCFTNWCGEAGGDCRLPNTLFMECLTSASLPAWPSGSLHVIFCNITLTLTFLCEFHTTFFDYSNHQVKLSHGRESNPHPWFAHKALTSLLQGNHQLWLLSVKYTLSNRCDVLFPLFLFHSFFCVYLYFSVFHVYVLCMFVLLLGDHRQRFGQPRRNVHGIDPLRHHQGKHYSHILQMIFLFCSMVLKTET